MTKGQRFIFMVPLAILGMMLFSFIGGEIVQQLWNWLLPSIFGWPALTFWQAFGMLVLCRILFGGFGFSGSRRYRRTPEERQEMRQRMRERFGFAPVAKPE